MSAMQSKFSLTTTLDECSGLYRSDRLTFFKVWMKSRLANKPSCSGLPIAGGDSHHLDARDQGGRFYPESFARAPWPINFPIAQLQGPNEVLPLQHAYLLIREHPATRADDRQGVRFDHWHRHLGFHGEALVELPQLRGDDRPLNDVLQLTNVSRPVVTSQSFIIDP